MISAIFNRHFSVYSYQVIDGDFGNWREDKVLVHNAKKCFLTKLSGNKPLYAGKLQTIATHRIFCLPLAIQSNQRIYCIETEQWFQILDIDDCSGLNHHYEILLSTINDPDDTEKSSSSSSEEYSSSSSSSSSGE